MNIPDFEEFSDISGELKDVYTKLKNELAEARRERDVLKLSLERASRWSVSDESLPEDVDIVAAFPLGRTDPGRFEVYAEAQRLVSAKRSKAALVDLVNWLLVREAEARRERYRLREALTEEEVRRLYREAWTPESEADEVLAFARAVEKFHGIGGDE